MVAANLNSNISTSRSNKTIKFALIGVALPSVLAVMALGPYLIGSIRIEQVFVYGTLVTLSPLIISRILTWYGWSVLIPWLTMLVIALISSQTDVIKGLPWESNSILAGLDALLLPVAVMAVVWSSVPKGRGKQALAWFSTTVIVLGLINTAIVLLQIVWNINDLLRVFWAASGDSDTVAERALTMGRYSGVFNQPAESGAFYSMALLLAVYRFKHNPKSLAFIFVALALGAVFSVSKVVLFVGIPVALVYMLFALGLLRTLAYAPIAVIVGAVMIGLSSFLNWSGFSFLTRFLNFGENPDLLTLLTAGRISGGDGNSTLMEVIGPIADSSPIIGVGLGGISAPYDSGWVEVFVYAGIIGVICMIGVYFGIFGLTFSLKDADLQLLSLAFLIMTFMVNTGISIFNANRIASITWAILSLLFVCLRDERNQTRQRKTGMHRVENEL